MSKKNIIVNFTIQKLKNKHISLKKYTNWAILGHVTQNLEFTSRTTSCEPKKSRNKRPFCGFSFELSIEQHDFDKNMLIVENKESFCCLSPTIYHKLQTEIWYRAKFFIKVDKSQKSIFIFVPSSKNLQVTVIFSTY